jgi:hypothetical protein
LLKDGITDDWTESMVLANLGRVCDKTFPWTDGIPLPLIKPICYGNLGVWKSLTQPTWLSLSGFVENKSPAHFNKL